MFSPLVGYEPPSKFTALSWLWKSTAHTQTGLLRWLEKRISIPALDWIGLDPICEIRSKMQLVYTF